MMTTRRKKRKCRKRHRSAQGIQNVTYLYPLLCSFLGVGDTYAFLLGVAKKGVGLIVPILVPRLSWYRDHFPSVYSYKKIAPHVRSLTTAPFGPEEERLFPALKELTLVSLRSIPRDFTIPHSVTIVNLPISPSRENPHLLKDHHLPQTLQKLHCGYSFNQSLTKGNVPRSLTELSFNTHSCFNGVFDVGVLPQSLLTLLLPSFYRWDFQVGVLPSNLTTLHCPWLSSFEQPGVLPKSLLILMTDLTGFPMTAVSINTFFFKFEALPHSLQMLGLPRNFHQSLMDSPLPPNLRHLHCGQSFNQPIFWSGSIEILLPKSLTSLHFGSSFNQVLPTGIFLELTSLTSLHFGCDFQQDLPKGVLPHSLLEIEVDYKTDAAFSVTSRQSYFRLHVVWLPRKKRRKHSSSLQQYGPWTFSEDGTSAKRKKKEEVMFVC